MKKTFATAGTIVVAAALLGVNLSLGWNSRSSYGFESTVGKSSGASHDRGLTSLVYDVLYSNASSLPIEFQGIKAQAWEPWPVENPLPCFPPIDNWKKSQMVRSDQGMLFLKTYKTGSSTGSGVALRIARNVARRMDQPDVPICDTRVDHAWAGRNYRNRIPEKAVLFSVVRDPSKRILSQFFHFEVSRKKIEPTDANFFDYVRRSGPPNMLGSYYVKSLSLQVGSDFDMEKGGGPAALIQQILNDYSFIGVTERMDESFVVLSMLFHIPLGDILYLTAKGKGGYDGGADGKCTYIWPSFKSAGIEKFLDGAEFKHISYWDELVYKVVNRSLDLTIDRLGRKKVAANLETFLRAKEVAHEQCIGEHTFPCSKSGEPIDQNYTDCIWKDSGCGASCLDKVAAQLDIDSLETIG